MRFLSLYRFLPHSSYMVRHFSFLTNRHVTRQNQLKHSTSILSPLVQNIRKMCLASEEDFDSDELFSTESIEDDMVKQLLYKDSKDPIIHQLNNSASISEAMKVFKENINVYGAEHLAQTILVLTDIQTMFFHYNTADQSQVEFISNLISNDDFKMFLKSVQSNVDNFPAELLSCVLYYLNQLGISAEDDLIQMLAFRLRNILKKDFHLGYCSRLFKVIFTENSIRPYYLSLPLIPKVIDKIGKCDSSSDLSYLTSCLNRLHNIISKNILKRYKDHVDLFIRSRKLDGKYTTLLKVIMFLNYPHWRNENITLISDCIMLLKEDINMLRIEELLRLYEVFFKNQEPGEVLNNLQRCSAQFLRRISEGENVTLHKHLHLFSALIYFSSPINRIQFRKDIQSIFSECNKDNINSNTLAILRKIFSYIKISDRGTCERYWNLTLEIAKKDANLDNILKLLQNYLHFNTDLASFRHYEFEKWAYQFIRNKMLSDEFVVPSEVSDYLSFMLVYGKNEILTQYILKRFEANLTQFRAIDCINVSYSLAALTDNQPQKVVSDVKRMLNNITQKLLQFNEDDHLQNCLLLKAAILRNDWDNAMVENMLVKFKEIDYMSSKIMENICYIFSATDALIPEVINKCTEYVVKNDGRVVGFNAEKILFTCYFLAYYPINAERFFQVVIDTIIRDQERMSGLAFLQSALALCFFNKLPSSFIKQIFTVEFMDKLDAELAGCYSREIYPQRVRYCLMQLNRAVCLEYPECNVPWFHKKYVDDIERQYMTRQTEIQFPLRIKDYLQKVVGEGVMENVITPYGYYIDFVVSLDENGSAVESYSDNVKTRIAIILLRPYSYTRFYTHPKGKYQHKKRHLEMLGYEVAIVKFTEWMNLLYAEERLEFISNLIWPNKVSKVKR